jgi:hypothetical protein
MRMAMGGGGLRDEFRIGAKEGMGRRHRHSENPCKSSHDPINIFSLHPLQHTKKKNFPFNLDNNRLPVNGGG